MMMLRNNRSGNTWARPCDTCGSSPCRVFCRADAAYLCSACDARVHAANQVASRHERVWMCEACERSPAAFLCKADSASLCASCDSDIHSANPLARRHLRLPILPLSGPSPQPPGSKRGATLVMAMAELEDEFDEDDEDEAASWLLPNPSTNTDTDKASKSNVDTAASGCFPGADVDEYLDLVEYTCGVGDNGQLSMGHTHTQYDSMVPNGAVQGNGTHDPHAYQMDVDFGIKSGYAYNSSSISHNVSVSSSPEVGIVPESTMSDISTTQPRPSKGTIDLFSCPPLQQVPMQLSPMDRQARVLRYWEKKKVRKFEKTIRYASRKAYAEKRPRIKGRFAKRTDAEDHQVDQMFANPIMSDGGYGIVPSF